jgi:tetratricopeptide (TPR) repeat protein
LELAQRGGDQRQLAFSYGEIGGVLIEEQQYPEALEQYDKALAINKSIGSRINIAYNQHNRGDILWRLGRYDDALQALNEANLIASQPESGYKQLIPEITRSYAQLALSERHFPEAKTKAEQALALAGIQYKNVTIEAKYTLGLANALSGSAREGNVLCEDAVKMATEAGDIALLSRAMLARAEVLLGQGDARAALEEAKQAQARFAKGGQQESEWRAWLVAALASQRLGDKTVAREQLVHAKDVLARLQQEWGPEVFKLYLARPDVQFYNKQLG